MEKYKYRFGDPVWVCLDGRNNSEAIFVCELFGCAKIIFSNGIEVMSVSFDFIKPRDHVGHHETWKIFPAEKPKDDELCIVSICYDGCDTKHRYTSVGWRSSALAKENAWIVDNEVRTDIEAWIPLPLPFKPNCD